MHTNCKISNCMICAAEAELAALELDAWAEVENLKEMAKDYEETVSWEETVQDCAIEEAKALADDHGYDEHEERLT